MENLVNNATFGLVVTDVGAVLIDPGGSWTGAEAVHSTIRDVTDQVAIYAIDPGGQDHCRQKDRGAQQSGQVVRDTLRTPRFGQTIGHPADDSAVFEDLAQKARTGITGQPLCTALDPKRAIEPGRDPR